MDRKALSIIAGAFMLAAVLAACSKDSTVAASPSTDQPSSQSSEVAVTLQEFAVVTDVASVPAGEVTFNVSNTGPDDTHEFVIIKTDIAAGDLPVDADGAAIEDAEGLEPITEIEDVAVGAVEPLTADLEPGAYVLVCNITQTEPDGSLEAHYKMGMFTAFTVA